MQNSKVKRKDKSNATYKEIRFGPMIQENNNLQSNFELQFSRVLNIILEHRNRAYHAINEQQLMTAWKIGAFVSARIKNAEWGKK